MLEYCIDKSSLGDYIAATGGADNFTGLTLKIAIGSLLHEKQTKQTNGQVIMQEYHVVKPLGSTTLFIHM